MNTLQQIEVFQEEIIRIHPTGKQSSVDLSSLGHQERFVAGA